MILATFASGVLTVLSQVERALDAYAARRAVSDRDATHHDVSGRGF